MSGTTAIACGSTVVPRSVRCPVLTLPHYSSQLPAYARAMRCPVLRKRMVLPGGHRHQAQARMLSAIALRTCCAMCGTELAYGNSAITLRASYAMSSTNPAYGCSAMLLRACYAMSGTEIGYRPTHAIRDVRY
eukprot:3936112-Rhodomonas_salina.5